LRYRTGDSQYFSDSRAEEPSVLEKYFFWSRVEGIFLPQLILFMLRIDVDRFWRRICEIYKARMEPPAAEIDEDRVGRFSGGVIGERSACPINIS
jgi:hypothetical protein